MATWPTVTDDDGTGTTGTILDNALFGSVRDYIGGAWTAVTFAAGNFTGNGTITWTLTAPDQVVFSYVVIGKTMTCNIQLATTTIAGAGSRLLILIPGSATAVSLSHFTAVAYCNDNGTLRNAYSYISDTTHIGVELESGANWTASTNATYVYFQITFEIA